MEKLLRKLFGMKYYVWRATTEKSWTLDYSGNDLTRFGDSILVKTFRAKTWKRAQDRFHTLRMKSGVLVMKVSIPYD